LYFSTASPRFVGPNFTKSAPTPTAKSAKKLSLVSPPLCETTIFQPAFLAVLTA